MWNLRYVWTRFHSILPESNANALKFCSTAAAPAKPDDDSTTSSNPANWSFSRAKNSAAGSTSGCWSKLSANASIVSAIALSFGSGKLQKSYWIWDLLFYESIPIRDLFDCVVMISVMTMTTTITSDFGWQQKYENMKTLQNWMDSLVPHYSWWQ